MNYHIIALPLDEDFIWCVIETKTDQLMRAFEFQDDADDYCEFLNRGGAFDGFTPPFILREVTLSKTLNQEFSEMLTE